MLAVQHDWCANLIRRREGRYESTRSRLVVEGPSVNVVRFARDAISPFVNVG
jgi:hypothetical protein